MVEQHKPHDTVPKKLKGGEREQEREHKVTN